MRKARFAPEARADLEKLHEYILDKSGSAEIAEHYLRRIFNQYQHLAEFPMRGTFDLG